MKQVWRKVLRVRDLILTKLLQATLGLSEKSLLFEKRSTRGNLEDGKDVIGG